jgi:DNA polymerase-3 subunit delta
MEELSEKKLEGVLLVISADVLDKKSKLRNLFEKNTQTLCVPCYADNTRDLELVALKILKENKITASKEIINLLIEKSNNDRGNLHNEIEKIKSFAVDKKNLEIDEIKSIINFSGEYKSDSLINECLSGNILQYKKILSEIYSNTINQIFLLRILSNKIQKLLRMKEVEKNYSNIDNLLSASRPPIFWKDKPIVKKQLTIWNFNDLKKINNEIDNTELLCKKNPQLSKVIFFNFFTKICKKANRFS